MKLSSLLFMLLVIVISLGSVMAAGDPKGERNLAARSSLPKGQGLAAQFNGDHKIQSHPAVIFADNFEQPDYKKRWDEARDSDNKVLSIVSPGGQGEEGVLGRKALKVTATLKQNTGGGLTQWFKPAETVFVRFYARFDKDCDYVHHFVTLRANKGLRGGDRWSGFGGAGLKPKGDERFSTALEPWG